MLPDFTIVVIMVAKKPLMIMDCPNCHAGEPIPNRTPLAFVDEMAYNHVCKETVYTS